MSVLDISTLAPKKPVDLHVDFTALSDFEKILALHHGSTVAEHKYDGFGLKLATDSEVQMYSLDNSAFNPACFPELTEAFAQLPSLKGIGELVGKSSGKRFRHDDEFRAVQLRPKNTYSARIDALAQEYPLEVRLYDLFEIDGKSLIGLPLQERLRILQQTLPMDGAISYAQGRVTSDAHELQSWLHTAFEEGKEGFVVKDLTTPYVPGKRTKDWLKLKRQTTFDLLVIGLYQTPERLQEQWPCANLLGGVINENTGKIETFGKITIPSRDLAGQIYDRLDGVLAHTWSKKKPYYWQNDKGTAKHDPSVEYAPTMVERGGEMMRKVPFLYVKNPLKNSFVVETSCLNVSTGKDSWHSCGLHEGPGHTMRQPKFLRVRDDKTTRQATTTQQVLGYTAG